MNLPLLIAEGGGFDPLDVAGAGNYLWTLLIFFISLPLMWKLVFSKIAGARHEGGAKAAGALTPGMA